MSTASETFLSESAKFAQQFAFFNQAAVEKSRIVAKWNLEEEQASLNDPTLLYENHVSYLRFINVFRVFRYM